MSWGNILEEKRGWKSGESAVSRRAERSKSEKGGNLGKGEIFKGRKERAKKGKKWRVGALKHPS